jgi:hypothetical protein
MKTFIAFRLRKELDADLIALGIDENSLPDLCRDGLRLMLGIKTSKRVEVKEKPIITSSEPKPLRHPQKSSSSAPILPGKPAIFRGGN